jgi:hypothetical protein
MGNDSEKAESKRRVNFMGFHSRSESRGALVFDFFSYLLFEINRIEKERWKT